MTDYDAYVHWCRSSMSKEQAAAAYGMSETEFDNAIMKYSINNEMMNMSLKRRAEKTHKLAEEQYKIAREAREKAGFQHEKLSTPSERALILKLIRDGLMIKVVAKAFNRSEWSIRDWMRKENKDE